jgi:hypothetical protein
MVVDGVKHPRHKQTSLRWLVDPETSVMPRQPSLVTGFVGCLYQHFGGIRGQVKSVASPFLVLSGLRSSHYLHYQQDLSSPAAVLLPQHYFYMA